MKIQLKNVQVVFIAIGLIGVLLFSSPIIYLLVKPPAGQEFSELYILGPNQTLDNIPFNIKNNVTYLIYLGVENNMGSSCYYTLLIKMGNTTQSLPDTTLGIPSSLPTLYEYKSVVGDTKTWETPLTFQVNQLNFTNGISQFSSITIDGVELPFNVTSAYNSGQAGYFYNLLVELWLFNSTLAVSQFNNRFVNLYLNMTQ